MKKSGAPKTSPKKTIPSKEERARPVHAKPPAGRTTFNEVCQVLCKPFPYLRQLQSKLNLHIPGDDEGYADNYVAFLNSVIVLRTFGVPMDEITDLFETEKKLLKLLKVDTLTNSKTWYLEFCVTSVNTSRDRLLLTHYDVSRSVTPGAVQFHLDFGTHEQELFSGAEMGEDVRHVLKLYRTMLTKVRERVHCEEPVLREALAWAARAFP